VTRLREERGGILVLSAVMIPVFLLLTALVVDVGNWYTHKRQLQNRADAAALAAGVEYGRQIYRCLGNASDVAIAEAEISQAARAYAGDRTYTPSGGGGPDGIPDPALSNTEIANQTNLDVMLNSTSYTAGTDFSDGGGACFPHPNDPAPENVTPQGGKWLDVKVNERDTKSLFSGFGLDLVRNIARARVKLAPAETLSGFVPLGIPDQRIAKAQARFINECDGSVLGTPVTLKPLATQTIPGLSLWGPTDGTTNPTTTPTPISFTMPAGITGCGTQRDYVPISVQIRAAGRPDIDLDALTCTQLQARPQADCWDQASYIRAWATEGDPGGPLSGDTVLVEDVNFDGAGGSTGCSADAYYARVPGTDTSCEMNASVYLDFDRRYSLGGTYEARLVVDGTQYTMTGPTTTPGNWFATGVDVPLDLEEARVDWEWRYKGPGTFQGTDCNHGSGCSQSGSVLVHHARATDGGSAYDTLTAVKLTSGPPGPTALEQHSVKLTDTLGGAQTYTGYLGVGLKSTFQVGDFAALRLRSGQRNYSLVCDPRFDQPSTSDMEAAFYFGCKPPFTYNSLLPGTYWWQDYTGDGEPDCPDSSSWLMGPPYPNTPWECVHADTGGNGFGVTDGIALRTKNCRNPAIDTVALTANCPGHNYVCNSPINVPGPGVSTADLLKDPRVIKIYILPFNAFNNVPTGANTDLPAIDFAAFYVTAWKYNSAVDPCPGNDNARLSNFISASDKPPQVGGYFIKYVDPDGGTVDENADCVLTDTKICRAVLVR
jgi:hypothetical protein